MAKKVSPAAHEGSAAMESSRVERVVISPPKLPVAEFALMGTAPLMVCRFSAKALTSIREKQEMGSTSRKGAQRAAKNFDADFNGARHVAREGGWDTFSNFFGVKYDPSDRVIWLYLVALLLVQLQAAQLLAKPLMQMLLTLISKRLMTRSNSEIRHSLT